MKALSQATLIELARAGAVRGDTLHGRTDGYLLSVQYGLHEAVLTAKRGGTCRFARIDTALTLLRTVRAAAVEVRLADIARPPRPDCRGCPVGLAALKRLHAEAATPPPAVPRARSPRGPHP
ncbi:hypothetical protein [Lysobacter firmicutimachus]|uniref:Uncharacterized protein n=1 Tax=Lysobacter firmicutimachus TaxID=1792846 RepID=A0ABU8CWX2_9GAMM